MGCTFKYIIAIVLEFDTDLFWNQDPNVYPHGSCRPRPSGENEYYLNGLPCTVSGIFTVVNRNNHYLSIYRAGDPLGVGINIPPSTIMNIPMSYTMQCGSMDWYFVSSGVLSPNVNPIVERPFAGLMRFTCDGC